MRLEDMTMEDFEKSPGLIQHIFVAGICNRPIGMSLYEEAIEKHPEYFPEEIEYKKKWDAIPQSVHDEYWKEYWEKDKEIKKDLPEATGLVGAMNNDDYHQALKKTYPARDKMRNNLHKKYYSKYGIKFKR